MYLYMINIIYVLFSFLLGLMLTIITNPPPYYILKLPNITDIYIDDNYKKYKYKLQKKK